jgi:hypothetical protein
MKLCSNSGEITTQGQTQKMEKHRETLNAWEDAKQEELAAVAKEVMSTLTDIAKTIANAAMQEVVDQLNHAVREVVFRLHVMHGSESQSHQTLGWRIYVYANQETIEKESENEGDDDASLFIVDILEDGTVVRVIRNTPIERGIIQRQCQLRPLPDTHPLATACPLYSDHHKIPKPPEAQPDAAAAHQNDEKGRVRLFYKRMSLLDCDTNGRAYIVGCRRPENPSTLYLAATYLVPRPESLLVQPDHKDQKDQKDEKKTLTQEEIDLMGTTETCVAYHWSVVRSSGAMALRIAEDGAVETYHSEDGVDRTVVWSKDRNNEKLWPIQPFWAASASGWRRNVPPAARRGDFKALWRHIELARELNDPRFMMTDILERSMRQLNQIQEAKDNRAYVDLAQKILNTHGEELLDNLPYSDPGCHSFGGFIRYNLACYHAVLGESETAILTLIDAVQKGGFCDFEWMRADQDFRTIRHLAQFQNLFPPSPPPSSPPPPSSSSTTENKDPTDDKDNDDDDDDDNDDDDDDNDDDDDDNDDDDDDDNDVSLLSSFSSSFSSSSSSS